MVDIYCLDAEDESGVWTMSRRITLPDSTHHQPWAPSPQGFRYGDELLWERSGWYFCYDPESQETKSLLGTKSSQIRSHALICYPYTPSLRLLPGMNTNTQMPKPIVVSSDSSKFFSALNQRN